MTKQEIRSLHTKARECRMWAGEQMAKAADAASEDDVQSFHGYMAEAGRLALLSAKYIKQARAANEGVAA